MIPPRPKPLGQDVVAVVLLTLLAGMALTALVVAGVTRSWPGVCR